MIRVLFVCLGNICRSPMAEAIFKKKLEDKGLGLKIEVDSCGTAAYHLGQDPDPRTVEIVSRNGIPIQHKGRQLITADFYKFDYILAMDRSNLSDILFLKPEDSKAKVMLFREFDPDHENADDVEVPDPYYGGKDGFKHVYTILARTSDTFLEELEK